MKETDKPPLPLSLGEVAGLEEVAGEAGDGRQLDLTEKGRSAEADSEDPTEETDKPPLPLSLGEVAGLEEVAGEAGDGRRLDLAEKGRSAEADSEDPTDRRLVSLAWRSRHCR